MTNKKKCVLLIMGILIIMSIGISIYLFKFLSYKKTVSSLTYSDISIENIEDGTYIGECNADFIYVKAAVTVLHGTITEIELLQHKQERGTPAEKITNEIIRQQKIDVDAVTGATNSSKVIKKAVENALTQ